EQAMSEFTDDREKVAGLAMRPPGKASEHMAWINDGMRPDVYGRNRYANLRTLDKAGARIILVEEVPEGEKWDAVRDRLRRSASAENIVTYDQDIAAWV